MNVLALSVHPDDETVGCGGTLLRHVERGDQLDWLILTKAHTPRWTEDAITRKAREVERVAAAYGIRSLVWRDFRTTELDVVGQAELIDSIRDAVAGARPEVVYLVHRGDVHTDHEAAFRAATSVLKPFHMRKLGVRRVLSFESLSSTEAAAPGGTTFVPTVFTDISSQIDRKLNIMQLYETEIQEDPLPRGVESIRALARFRGATIGAEYAEAFMLVREIS